MWQNFGETGAFPMSMENAKRQQYGQLSERKLEEKALETEQANRELTRELREYKRGGELSEQIVNSLPGVFYVMSRDGRYLRWNRNFERVVGYSAEEMRQLNPLDLFRGRDRELMEQRIRQAFETGEADIEADLYSRTGASYPYYFTGKLVVFDGQPCLIGMGLDISERRQAQLALQASQQRFTDLVNEVEGVVWEADATTFNFTFVSNFAETLLGYPLSCWYEPGFWREHIHPDDRDSAVRYCLECTARGAGHDFEYRMLSNDGRVVWLHDIVTVEMVNGQPQSLRGVMMDISARKQEGAARALLEAQLRQAQKMEALGTLAGGIAHDFNNLLSTIAGNAQLASDDAHAGRIAHDSISEILRAAQRAKDLVQRILAFSRPQEQRLAPVQLGPVLVEAVRLLRSTLPAGVELSFLDTSQLPDVRADGSQIHQVVMNLVTNAWHALEGRAGRIAISAELKTLDMPLVIATPPLNAGEYVRISVIDDGKGMDETTAARIFEPFYTTKAPGQGTGLGLAVVHGIVRSHGGGIVVTSEPGCGSRFDVYLPVSPEEAEVAKPTANVSAPTQAQGHGEHILYVDDDEALVYLVERFLQRLGYRVSGYTLATDALAAFRADPHTFDLIITDSNMPGMSGLELARELLKVRADAAVVLTSGYLRTEEIEKARALGVMDVILKPNTIEELGPTLKRVLQTGR